MRALSSTPSVCSCSTVSNRRSFGRRWPIRPTFASSKTSRSSTGSTICANECDSRGRAKTEKRRKMTEKKGQIRNNNRLDHHRPMEVQGAITVEAKGQEEIKIHPKMMKRKVQEDKRLPPPHRAANSNRCSFEVDSEKLKRNKGKILKPNQNRNIAKKQIHEKIQRKNENNAAHNLRLLDEVNEMFVNFISSTKKAVYSLNKPQKRQRKNSKNPPFLLPFYMMSFFSCLFFLPLNRMASAETVNIGGLLAEMPTRCESCLVLAGELDAAAKRLPPKMDHIEAEGWLEEWLEGVCAGMLQYRVHRDRGQGLERFARGATSTARAIREMEARGVDVRLDQPSALLDVPPAEAGRLRSDCEWILDEFGAEIERWFFKRRAQLTLADYLCRGRLARGFDSSCGVGMKKTAKKSTRNGEL